MKKKLLLCFFLWVSWSLAIAQERRITGKVISAEDNSPLPGVSVVLKGTGKGVTSDANGNYVLSMSTSTGMLVFSFVGTVTQEIAIGNQSVLNVSLQMATNALNEIVVVAMGLLPVHYYLSGFRDPDALIGKALFSDKDPSGRLTYGEMPAGFRVLTSTPAAMVSSATRSV